jgi:pimeloyl-ACP methyl ester carboxylesterase
MSQTPNAAPDGFFLDSYAGLNSMKIRALSIAFATCLIAAGCGQKTPPAPAAVPAKPTASPAVVAPRAPVPPQAEAREATVKSLASDHSKIRYRVYGKGEPTLVLIHGWSCDSGYWDSQLNELAQTYTLITLDLAGHGKSDVKKRKDWSMANFGADVAAVVNAVGQPRVILVGHSMGGPVALEAARQLQGKVIGIVGVDTLRQIAAPYPKEQTEPLLAAMHQDFAKATADFVANNFFTDQTDPIVKKWIIKDMSSAPRKVAIPALEALLAMDYRKAVADLDVPIVAINADPPPTDEAAIRRVEPRFRVVPVPGVGHFLMMEKPDFFNTALRRIADRWASLEPRAQ